MLKTYSVLLFCFLLINVSLFGHGELDELIEQISKRIEQAPNNANLYLKRGQFYAQHKEYASAKEDYIHARNLDQSLLITDLLLAKVYVLDNQAHIALTYANTFIIHYPDHPNALIVRAGIYQQLRLRDSCQKDLERAMANLKTPNPRHYISIAEAILLNNVSNVEEALAWLKKGQERFGFDIVLKSKEVELYLKAKQYKQAIQIIDEIILHFPRKEKWLFQKAMIYNETGNTDQAKIYFDATLIAIQQLPKRLQSTKRILQLEVQTLENLAMLSK